MPGIFFVAAVHSADSIFGDILIVGDSRGCLCLFDSYELTLLTEIPDKDELSVMICPIPDLVFAGYRKGSIKVWHIASTSV